MESKKINQLATEMAPASTDLTIIGDPITGVSKKVTLEQISSLFSGLVSFYANYAAFPATGEIDTIYCAKDTSKLYLWSGSAYVEVFPSQALLNTYQLRSEKGASNGYASLDSLGKVPIAQLPSSLMEYKGTWNASTNTPTLANGTGDTGDVYICSVAGTVNFGAGAITFAVGDYVIYSGTIWQRSSGATGTVTSVGITETGDALTITGSPITTSGTINIGFAGSAAQYVAGDGSLVTFPTLLGSDSLVKLVRNQSGATMTAGTVIYISGATGNKPLISKALATGDATSAQTYGLLQTDIANNADGYVVIIGNVTSLDTSALTEGQQLYLSGTTAGTYTTTKPYAPIHLVYVGIVLRAHPTMGIISVKIQNGYEMDELHNVDAYLPNNNDILSYNTTTSLWEHKQIATTLGYTPANDSLVVHLSGTETISGAKTFTNSNVFSGANLFTTWSQRFNQGVAILETANFGSTLGYTTLVGAVNGLALRLSDDGKKIFAFASGTSNNTFTFPNATGTVALTSDLTGGTVTSAALSAPTGFSVTGSPVTTTGTLALSFAAGYSLPTDASQTNWDSAYTNRITSLTTTGNSGSATLVSNTLNVPTYTLAGLGGISLTSLSATTPLSYNNTTGAFSIQVANTSQDGYLSSTDWNTFNGKQNTITNPVTGTGTSGQVTYFNGTSSVTSSSSFKFDGTNLTIGNPSSALAQLHVYNASAAATILLQTNSTTDYSEIAVRNNSSTATSYFRQYSTAATGSDFGISRAGLALFFSNYATNFAIGTRNGGDLILGTADTERVRILSSNGYFGIGYSSPSYKLDVNGEARFKDGAYFGASATGDIFVSPSTGYMYYEYPTSYGGIFRTQSGVQSLLLAASGAATFSSSVTTNGYINNYLDQGALRLYNSSTAFAGGIGTGAWVEGSATTDIAIYSSNNLKLYTGASSTSKMTITSAGNVGIGTSSPIGGVFKLQVGDGSADTRAIIVSNSVYQLGFRNGSGNPVCYDGSDTSGNRIFSNNAGGELMRITSGGNVLIGTSSDNGYKNQIIASTYGLYISVGSTSSHYPLNIENSGFTALFRVRADGLIMTGTNTLSPYNFTTGTGANMVVDSSGYLYRSTSSLKYKTNVTDYDKGLDIITKMKPVYYNSKNNGDTLFAGLIAEDIHELGLTEFVQYAEDGSPDALSYSNMVALLIKGMQEQQKQIEAQQQQINSLINK